MRVFVAGATGAIGKQLVPRLVAAGHEVHGMTRSESKQAMLDELSAVPVVADALDPDQVAKAVGRRRPEVIVHQLTAIGAVDLRHMERDFAPTNVCRPRGSCCATAGSTGRASRSCPTSPPWSLTIAALGRAAASRARWSPRFPSTASLDGSRVARPLPPFASSGPSSGMAARDDSTSSPSTSRWSAGQGSSRSLRPMRQIATSRR